MRKEIINRFAFIVLLALIGALFFTPSQKISALFGDNSFTQKISEYQIALGLDLVGGAELDYKIDLSEAEAQNSDDDPSNDVSIVALTNSVRDAIEQRVNPAGVGEITVQKATTTINGVQEHHILIQMPAGTDIEKAKRDAQKDNRLEFFAERDSAEVMAPIKKVRENITTANWKRETEKILTENPAVKLLKKEGIDAERLLPQELVEGVKNAKSGQILPNTVPFIEVPTYQVDASGQIDLSAFQNPARYTGIFYLKSKKSDTKTSPNPTVKARHILIAWSGASGVQESDKIPYKTKEEAKEKAEEILQTVQKNPKDFEALAKEFSTEPGAAESGGDLGEFPKGRMVKPFEEAVFTKDQIGVLPEIVETDFGFHIIEVLEQNLYQTKTETTVTIDYEMLVWDSEEITWEKTKLSGKDLDAASKGYYENSRKPLVNLRLSSAGGEIFGDITELLTKRNCNNGVGACRLLIKVGGSPLSSPRVTEKILGRDVQITGQFTEKEATDLANDLNLGAIDAPVILSTQTNIAATLGQAQLDKSIKAIIAGFLAVAVAMLLVYRLPGLMAILALIIYGLLYVTLLKLWPESFGGPIVITLSGAAGIALSLGVAVDGNILIFERMKEELRRGRDLADAIDLGFSRAWPAIIDSNTTTLLVCIILFTVGSSVLKGFAITLIVGTILSMFTAISISRNLLRFLTLFKMFQKPSLFGHDGTFEKSGTPNIRKRK